MKKKYVFILPYLEYEQSLMDLLEKLAKQGWTLEKVGLFLVFKKTGKYYKHQIDLNERNEEYNLIINDLGYLHVGSFNKIHFYISEDVNAADLYTEEETFKQRHLNRYKIERIGHLVFILLLIFAQNTLTTLSQINFSKLDYIINPQNYLELLSVIFISAIFLLRSIEYSLKRKAIIENIFTYQKFHLLDLFLLIIQLLHIFMVYYFELIVCPLETMSLVIPVVLLIYFYLDSFIFSKAKTEEERLISSGSVAFIAAALLYAILFFGSYHFGNPNRNLIYHYDLPTEAIDYCYFKDNKYIHMVTAQKEGYTGVNVSNDIVLSDIVYIECTNDNIRDICLETLTNNKKEISNHIFIDEKSLVYTDQLKIIKVPYNEEMNMIDITTTILNYFNKN